MNRSKILNFDITNYKFKELIQDLLKLEHLEKLPNAFDLDDKIKPISKDTHSHPHKLFYSKLDNGWSDFTDLYNKFIKEFVLKTLKKEKILYQTLPNLRISLPNSVAVSTWHRDSDKDNLHPSGEINFFLPITKAFDTNTIWIESEKDKKDFQPINMNYGEIFMFKGGDLMHGNKVNNTSKTRISFDFRVLPMENYDPNHPYKTRTKNLAFKPGEYYSEASI